LIPIRKAVPATGAKGVEPVRLNAEMRNARTEAA
jgi:hypothetical protein